MKRMRSWKENAKEKGREREIFKTLARHKYLLSPHGTNWLVEEKANKRSYKWTYSY